MRKNEQITVCAHPSIALIKYWGKAARGYNRAATTSIAITVNALKSIITIKKMSGEQRDSVQNNNNNIPESILKTKYQPFLSYAKSQLNIQESNFAINIKNNFPIAAGLASSASIFAGLTLALHAYMDGSKSEKALSRIARHGSTSAARAIRGGFTILKARHRSASALRGSDDWHALRLITAITSTDQKAISSRDAMRIVQQSSSIYSVWKRDARAMSRTAIAAIRAKDLRTLGHMMRHSYLMMFATMLTARPPILYWNGQSVDIIQMCETLRSKHIAAWETMDAGAQVKILTTSEYADAVVDNLCAIIPKKSIIVSEVGAAPHYMHTNSAD